MRGKMMIGAVATLLASTGAEAAVPITYTGAQQVGTVAATYSITTDGTTNATLTDANLLDYTIRLDGTANSAVFSKANGFTVGQFYATATTLSTNTYNGIVFEQKSTSVGVSYGTYLLFSNPSTVASIDLGATAINQIRYVANSAGFASVTSAVPEPATWAMLLAGVGVVGAATRRRRKPAHVALA